MINPSPDTCSGCTACKAVCPVNAIDMKPDAMGFLYPVIDREKCVNCGLCERTCAFHPNYDKTSNLPVPDSYAVRHNDINEVSTSQSGAAFIAVSDAILKKGGVVYGAGYKDHFRVVHKRATNSRERDEFKGSKYVQSDMGECFNQVKKDLEAGLLVLFSGTPCQTAGLASFIGPRLRENLYLVDIVCHGVPGPYVWRDYVDYLEKKEGRKIIWANFRDKQRYGWKSHVETFKFEGGGGKIMSYAFLFYQHLLFRHSCGKCPYTNTKRPSDITIADFWGVEKALPDFHPDNKGVSLMLVNTEKGRRLFDLIKDDLDFKAVDLELCLQPNLCRPSPMHPQRNNLERDYVRKGFKYVYRKYGNQSLYYKVRIFPYRVMNKLRSIAKKIFK